MKLLIMCEGPNELKIINILLENEKLVFTSEDLLGLVPYHARQIKSSAAVKAALNLYPEEVHVLRIGDGQNEKLEILYNWIPHHCPPRVRSAAGSVSLVCCSTVSVSPGRSYQGAGIPFCEYP